MLHICATSRMASKSVEHELISAKKQHLSKICQKLIGYSKEVIRFLVFGLVNEFLYEKEHLFIWLIYTVWWCSAPPALMDEPPLTTSC